MDSWIPVTEHWPTETGEYIVYLDNTCIGGTVKVVTSRIFAGGHFFLKDFDGEVTHWQPMPNAPL